MFYDGTVYFSNVHNIRQCRALVMTNQISTNNIVIEKNTSYPGCQKTLRCLCHSSGSGLHTDSQLCKKKIWLDVIYIFVLFNTSHC